MIYRILTRKERKQSTFALAFTDVDRLISFVERNFGDYDDVIITSTGHSTINFNTKTKKFYVLDVTGQLMEEYKK